MASNNLDDSEVRILHITDLHVGRQFNEVIWNAFEGAASVLRPHLIIVTGDLVDTPFRGRLKRAKRKLEGLIDKLNQGAEASHHCRLIIIPGNHDTRFSGIIPWFEKGPLLSSLILLLIAALSAMGIGWWQGVLVSFWSTISFLVLLLGAVFFLCGTINSYFDKTVAIAEPTSFDFGEITLHHSIRRRNQLLLPAALYRLCNSQENPSLLAMGLCRTALR
jgi:hypothetical protein